jgi:hypothetical protein
VLSHAQVFNVQDQEDSAHFWNLIVSRVDETILFGLQACLAVYGNQGP